MDSLPDVQNAVSSGSISLEQAAVVVRGAEGSTSAARELLGEARNGSVESVRRKAQELNAAKQSLSQRQRLRRSQFFNLRQGLDNMVTGEFKLLAEHAGPILEAHRKSSGFTSFERAESLASQLGSKTAKPRVVFHLDLTADFTIGDRFEQVGLGPISKLAVFDIIEQASFALVGRVNNKLVWFDEADNRKSSVELPEFIKRAVRESQWDVCGGCTEVVDEIDHIVARTNGGGHDPTNLRGLCKRCHDQKTRQDAPWTAGGIYGPEAKWRKQKQARGSTLLEDEPVVDELFADLN